MGLDLYILDRESKPLRLTESDDVVWRQFMQSDPRRHLAHTEWLAEDGKVTVDTVFVGVARHTQIGRPQLWDTHAYLVPEDHGFPELIGLWQYRSRASAMNGHAAAVQRLSGGLVDVDQGRGNGRLR